MKFERTTNAIRNIFWGVLEKVITLLLPFITRTVLIKVLGAEYLGLSSLFTSILQVLSISELGFGTAIVFSMYKPIAEDDRETLCALLNVYRRIYRVIATVILVVGLALLPFLQFLIKGEHPADVNLYLLYIIYLSNTVISYYLYAYKQALFSAHQRNDLASKRNAIISFTRSITQIVVLLYFKNYYAYVILIPFATIATNIANAYLAKKIYPYAVCRGEVSPEVMDGLKKRVIGLVSFKIYGVVFSSVDTIVISSFLGLKPLAIYNNYLYIQTAIVGFLTILTSSITAGVGNKMITNSREDNYKDFMRVFFANGWIVSFCSICLVCLYQPFMELWVGKELTFPVITMILMVLYFLLPRITTVTFTYREAAGLWWEDRYRPLIATVANLTVNIVLVKIIGMNGVIISTLICTVLINVPWGTIILFKNYFKISPNEYFGTLIWYVFVTIVVGTISWSITNAISVDGIVGLAIKAIVCIVIPNFAFWILYRKRDEFDYFTNYLRGLIAKVKKG